MAGKSFPLVATMFAQPYGRSPRAQDEPIDEVVFKVPPGANAFRATVGVTDNYTVKGSGSIVFRVLVDGAEAFRSERMDLSSEPAPVQVGVDGASAISLIVSGEGMRSSSMGARTRAAAWLDPEFVTVPAAIPKLALPQPNETLVGKAELMWSSVDGASGYLLEAQCYSAASVGERQRFLAVELGPQVTHYNLESTKFAAGKWRWRVSALSPKGYLGEMKDWRLFTLK